MPETRDENRLQRWGGLALVVMVVLVSGAFLETAADETGDEWLLRAYLVVGLLTIVGYIMLVHFPARKNARELSELSRSCSEQSAALGTVLTRLRHGDMVAVAEPDRGLPPELQEDLTAASRTLAALIQQIQSSSVDVAASAGTVQRTSSELASASSQQAAAVLEITATTEELARTAGQIASSAESQAVLASEAQNAGEAGVGSVEAAVSGVEAVRQHVEAISGRADALGSRSREIYRILDLITEIAQETHILSLNAAIEASAAGEHGDRFSVVAEEVRRLAERSRESVDSVRSHLDEFSGSIRGVVVATEGGTKAAEQVLDQSRSVQESITQLRGALRETAQAAREISLATREQRNASDQVVQTLREVSEVVQRIAEGLSRYTVAADELNEFALSIQLLTQSFRIDSKHSLKHQLSKWAGRLRDYTGNLEAVEGLLEELADECPFLELLYLVDVNGMMIAFVINRDLVGEVELPGGSGVGHSYADRPWFQAVARNESSVVTPTYESLLTGNPCFTIAMAVHDHDGERVGTLGIDVNLHNWTRI